MADKLLGGLKLPSMWALMSECRQISLQLTPYVAAVLPSSLSSEFYFLLHSRPTLSRTLRGPRLLNVVCLSVSVVWCEVRVVAVRARMHMSVVLHSARARLRVLPWCAFVRVLGAGGVHVYAVSSLCVWCVMVN